LKRWSTGSLFDHGIITVVMITGSSNTHSHRSVIQTIKSMSYKLKE